MRRSREVEPVKLNSHADLRYNPARVTAIHSAKQEFFKEIYQSIFNAANDIVFVIEIKTGRILEVNDRVGEVYGFTREQVLYTNIKDYCLEEPRYTIKEARVWAENALTGRAQIFEWKVRHRQGQIIWVEVNLKKICFKGKDYLMAIVHDIHKRKAGEQALITSDERYRAIFETTGAATIIVEDDMTIILANTGFERLSGYYRKEMEGQMSLLNLVCPEEREKIEKLHRLRRIDPQGAPTHYECRAVDRYGRGKYLEVVAALIPGSKQSVASFLDITDRKRAEDRVRLAVEVLDNMSEGLLLISISGIIKMANPAFYAITGYSPEDLPHLQLTTLVGLSWDNSMVQKEWTEYLKRGKWQGEMKFRRRDGKYFPAWVSLRLVKDQQGKISKHVLIMIDISEIVHLRNEKARAKEQTARTQRLVSLSALSGGIIHEIAQPLNAISLLADGALFLMDKEKSLDSLETAETFCQIRVQVGRIEKIVHHVRNFATLNHQLETDCCDLNRAVTGVLDLLGRQLAAHGITIRLDLNKDLPPVPGQVNQMEEVVVNLLVNAMQALDQIDGRDKEILCRTGQEGEQIILAVSDNATGITSEIMESIFDPLFSTKEGGGGMGLGLPIITAIIHAYQGQIKVNNNPKGGATFRVYLPRYKERDI